MSLGQIFIIAVTFLITIVIIICVFNFQKFRDFWRDQRDSQVSSSGQLQQSCSQSTPAAASMTCTLGSVLDRQLLEPGDHQDHLVRLHSVQTDLALNLPHSVSLPDGEEYAKCNIKMLKLRDPEQQAEITCSFIRPPPNRTISDKEYLQPLLSNSVPSSPPLPRVAASVLVPRSNSVSHVHRGKLDFVRKQNLSNSDFSRIWLPSSAAENSHNVRKSGTSKRNRTNKCVQAVIDNKSDSTLLPPSYNDVVKNKTHMNPVVGHHNTNATDINPRICRSSMTSNRTYDCAQAIIGRDCENTDPPPSYNDVVNKTNIGSTYRQQK